ncbi:MAG: hypothetical protein ACRC9N_06315 [Aeromonas sp.]
MQAITKDSTNEAQAQAIANQVADVSLAIGSIASMLAAGGCAKAKDIDSFMMGIGANLEFATGRLDKILTALDVLGDRLELGR